MNDNKISKVNVPKIYIKNKSNEKNNNKHFLNKKINYKDKNKTRKNKQNFNLLKIKKLSRLLNIASNYWIKFFN